MDEEDFWSLIDELAEIHEGEDQAFLEGLASDLREQGAAAAKDFHRHLGAKIDALATPVHAAACHLVLGSYPEEDEVLAHRAWIVAHGHESYEMVEDEPDRVVELEDELPPSEWLMPELLTVASEAYEELAGQELDPIGEDYEDEPLEASDWEAALPVLWARFREGTEAMADSSSRLGDDDRSGKGGEDDDADGEDLSEEDED